jgi:hypothetical protein
MLKKMLISEIAFYERREKCGKGQRFFSNIEVGE